MTFLEILEKHRKLATSERDKGDRFERLMQGYLQTDPQYAHQFKSVWLWSEFPAKADFGGKETGIDLVALTFNGEYWAIQCKCYQQSGMINKPAVDSFLATSSKVFTGEYGKTIGFSERLWISTTNNWNLNAEEAIRNQSPSVTRLNLQALIDAPVDWEKLDKGVFGSLARTAKKTPFPHQEVAIENTHEYFKQADRGKLIMACGTGKTFTSLRIAEHETEGKRLILFLVPSIALLGQTLREWAADAQEPIHPICICSDAQVTKKKGNHDDSNINGTLDLAQPASTDVKKIVRQFQEVRAAAKPGMTVVFSTYQSIEVIAEAQKALLEAEGDYGVFDLVICDEAHRTTGVKLAGEGESAFVKVHDNDFLKARKRLYMTATPRLYSEDSKTRADMADATLWSMDKPEYYGNEIYRIGFGEAVEKDLLTDYKVLILTLSDADVPPAIQTIIANRENEINSDDASKLIGCINALSKQILGDEGIIKSSDPEPMRRAVAFCQNIKVSRKITETFNTAGEVYLDSLLSERRDEMVTVNSKHIDGSMTAPRRDELMGWLKSTAADTGECRVLTNVRCLSEGVDVPSLDAVMFLSARNSQVDVVQSVGRVMRKAPGKKYGYIIIPVVVPSNVEAASALDDNERYRVVWTVLNALRAHDDRFNATINKIDLNKKRPSQILVGRPDTGLWDENNQVREEQAAYGDLGQQLALQFEQLQRVVFARMVQKVGDRRYWEQWAKNVAEIAERQVERITLLVAEEGDHKAAFEDFLEGLRKNINPAISAQEAIEMLSQHIITRPVFEALFEGYSFVQQNPISISMQKMLDVLESRALEKDTETLDNFYESVKKRAEGIDNAEGKQRIIIELYDKFFKTAFPKMVEQLGIVYTPIEVVDFIIRSVHDVLKEEFGRSISDENIHVLDPFTGTGTFITRLIQSGLIRQRDLPRKYEQELHANEIVLLAYYIAAINIENAYHDLVGEGKEYRSFEGIVLTDTFQLGETDASEKLFSEMFPRNSERVERQKKAPIRVIIGNPPYSVGQRSANDNAQNLKYEKLDARIANTYAALTSATNKNSLYDSYIKAFRWSSDRIEQENGGIICLVTNGAWIDGNAQNGFRKALEKEFSSIWVFNLRGNQRTSGELSRKEGGKIFGSGSRTPISITLLVKNPASKAQKAVIRYCDIGDYLKREEKLKLLDAYGSVANPEMQWKTLVPDRNGDWVNQRNALFETFVPIGDKKAKSGETFFVPFYGRGVATARDAYCYNFSQKALTSVINEFIDFYNIQRKSFHKAKKKQHDLKPDNFVDFQSVKVTWNRGLKNDLERNTNISFREKAIYQGLYRPFSKQHLYFSKELNDMVYQMPKLFPNPDSNNLVICIPAPGGNKELSVILTDVIPDLHLNGDAQCFPLYYYEKPDQQVPGLFDKAVDGEFVRKDGITDYILRQAQRAYGKKVTKEDLFYYVYGFLHSPDYRAAFANDLKKLLPRIPLVDRSQDFWAFSEAGRALADLHLNYESVPPCEGVKVTYANTDVRDAVEFIGSGLKDHDFLVEKMRFPKKGEWDRIIYNGKIVISDIPERAYTYIVNGKSAIEWVMERYQVKTDKKSGIKNDPNDWAKESGNPRYILELLLSVINLSIRTMDIVEGLPKLSFEEKETTPA